MEEAVLGEGLRWLAGQAAAGDAALGRGRRCGGRGDPDARDQAAGSHAVEHAVDGQGVRAKLGDGEPHLAGLCPEAVAQRDVQAVARPPVHRESARCRRTVHAPA